MNLIEANRISAAELRDAMHPTFDSAIRNAPVRQGAPRPTPPFLVTAWSVFSLAFLAILFLASLVLAAKAPDNIRLTLEQAATMR